MQIYNVDLHIHGPFAGGTSKNLCVEKIAEMAHLKGLHIAPVGDLTHKTWQEMVFSKLQKEDENYFYELPQKKERVYFALSTEVEDANRVHHVVLFPDREAINKFREEIKPFSSGLDGVLDGRPRVKIKADKIAEICVKLDLVFGPAHAFTPYFGIYAHFDSLKHAYSEYFQNVSFLELGLSADTNMANMIAELEPIPFLSNSDAHSFWPNKLGREFNKIKMKAPNFFEIKEGLAKKEGREIVMNVGLNPKEGKYHKSACVKCLAIYTFEEAKSLKWKCPCNGTIKKGVYDRVMELSTDFNKPARPKYFYNLPLSEIIAVAVGAKDAMSPKVYELWQKFVGVCRNEISCLLEASESELSSVDENVTKYIMAFRNGFVSYYPGGGGEYGIPFIAFSKSEAEENETKIAEMIEEKKQKALHKHPNKTNPQKKLFEY